MGFLRSVKTKKPAIRWLFIGLSGVIFVVQIYLQYLKISGLTGLIVRGDFALQLHRRP